MSKDTMQRVQVLIKAFTAAVNTDKGNLRAPGYRELIGVAIDALELAIQSGVINMNEMEKLSANITALATKMDAVIKALSDRVDLQKQIAMQTDQITALKNPPPAPPDPALVAANTALADAMAKLSAAGL